MKIDENQNHEELHKVNERTEWIEKQFYKERNSPREHKMAPDDYNEKAGGTAKAAASTKKKKSRNIFAAAAVALASVVTVTAIALSFNVTLLSFNVGYDYVSFVLNIANAPQDEQLVCNLMSDRERIDSIPIDSGEQFESAFESLMWDSLYTLEVSNGSGEVVFSKDFTTLSPVSFESMAEYPNRVYFDIDEAALQRWVEWWPGLADSNYNDCAGFIYEDESGRNYIDFSYLHTGQYYFVLNGAESGESGGGSSVIYEKSLTGGALSPLVISFGEDGSGFTYQLMSGDVSRYANVQVFAEVAGEYINLNFEGDLHDMHSVSLPGRYFNFIITADMEMDSYTVNRTVYSHFVDLDNL